ncbi:MAG: hypothetical protein V1873_02195 [Verrucomicrobiota bacterium]
MNAGRWTLVAACLAAATAVYAEDLVLFSAAGSPAELWTWGGAKIVKQEGKLLVSNNNPKGSAGDVYIEERFAYVPAANVEVNVDRVVSGDYAVQVLAFKGDIFLGSVDLVKGSLRTGLQLFPLVNAKLPGGADRVSFKIWVAGAPTSATVLNDLRYYVPVTPANILYDKKIDASVTNLVADKATCRAGDNGAAISLLPGEPYGSVVFLDQIAKPPQGTLVVQASDIQNATLTAQVCAFDQWGNYIDSLDAIKRGGTTLSGSLAALPWAPEAATFQVKVWLGGSTNASAVIHRIAVVK